MVFRLVTSVLTSTATPVVLLGGDSLLVARNGVVATTGAGVGVDGDGSDISVRLEGSIYGGIYLGNGVGSVREHLVVAETGVAWGPSAAIYVNAAQSHVSNYGSIFGEVNGIRLGGLGAVTKTHLVNYGTIDSNDATIYAISEGVILRNDGLIRSGGDYAIVFGSNVDTVRNTGVIEGNVYFWGGNDRYDGRGGQVVDGTISMGDGTDEVRPGNGNETIDGGTGIDQLNFSFSSGGRVALDNVIEATGAAEGDVYSNFEKILGSRQGADELQGDAGNNSLIGQGGADTLGGGAGVDTLMGGIGVDSLTGGLGDDQFVFFDLREAGDRISEFRNQVGDDDILLLSAAGFGGGLVAGALAASQFITRADAQAQDANDRFIFKTTDQTLWFDVNGSATGGLTLLARLSTSDAVTAADILLL